MNGDLTSDQVTVSSNKKVWWKCPAGEDHEWIAIVNDRTKEHGTGCPACGGRWTVDNIRRFVRSLLPHIDHLSPAEFFALAQQSGALGSIGIAAPLVKAMTTGRLPKNVLTDFAHGKPSAAVDALVGGEPRSGEILSRRPDPIGDVTSMAADTELHAAELELPIVHAGDALRVVDHSVVANADAEAVEFFVASARHKLWRHAMQDEDEAIREIREYSGDEYSTQVRESFLDEYDAARSLPLPDGYHFSIDGIRAEPFLMQRLVATLVAKHRRYGNWSGTGAGKTQSAILASRVIDASLTLIFCPNNVISNWTTNIPAAFNNTQVQTKTWSPIWDGFSAKYLVLNYEMLQQKDSDQRIKEFLSQNRIDFVVIDEVHYAKQRQVDNMSRRKHNLMALLSEARDQNPELAVLGLSATPVINNLQEGKSLMEMLRGEELPELKTRATVTNCMALHQQLLTHGIRSVPEYPTQCHEEVIEVDCGELVPEITGLGRSPSPLDLEKVLTRARLPAILRSLEPQTLVYTHLISEIGETLRDAIEDAGWSVGFFTGEDKSGLDRFLRKEIDVLIGTSAIGTGVDGLQHVCKKLVFNVLPWTHAEYQQIKGRIYRHGQPHDVSFVIPSTYADLEGGRWSYCESKRKRIEYKRSIADAAVDGWVPDGQLRSPAQALRDAMDWLERLSSGEVAHVDRPHISVPLPQLVTDESKQRIAKYGDFSKMNRRWNTTNSGKTYERLSENPEEWMQYHALFREARAKWVRVPADEIVRWLRRAEDWQVGDFGCGEGLIAEAIRDRHTVHSFDHVAVNEQVIAGDMSRVPLDDNALDVAVFSLSLMGANFGDYLKEAHRVLKIYGHLHIVEATSRFGDLDGFVQSLRQMGFDRVEASAMSDQFTWIQANRADRAYRDTNIRF
jgi:hypothetical protein